MEKVLGSDRSYDGGGGSIGDSNAMSGERHNIGYATLRTFRILFLQPRSEFRKARMVDHKSFQKNMYYVPKIARAITCGRHKL